MNKGKGVFMGQIVQGGSIHVLLTFRVPVSIL